MQSKKWIVIGSFSIILLWVGYYFVIKTVDEPGTFGDMFGGLNTLFTGLAFAGVVISLMQQNEALKQQQEALDKQKEELVLYKNELKDNTAQLIEQSNNLHLQRIENTLFNLLEAHNKIVANLKSDQEPNYTGSSLLNHIFNSATQQGLNQTFEEDTTKSQGHFLSYFLEGSISDALLIYENFISLLAYIDKRDIKDKEKMEFSAIINSQLSLGQKYAYLIIYEVNKGLNHDVEDQKRLIDKYL